jgi:hypothetical protein
VVVAFYDAVQQGDMTSARRFLVGGPVAFTDYRLIASNQTT